MSQNRAISVSMINTWLRCQRLWAHIYIDGKKRSETRATRVGSKIHEIIETYMRTGEDIDLTEVFENVTVGKRAATLIEHLPKPPQKDVEIKRIIERDGIKWTYIIDLLTDECIYDHKTTSDLKWALTYETFVRDPQVLIYMYLSGIHRAQWTYVTTRGPIKTSKVRQHILRVEDKVLPYLEIADMLTNKLRSGDKVASYPCNPAACSMYGGCEHQILCDMSGDRKKALYSMLTNKEEESMNINKLLETARAKKMEAQKNEEKKTRPPQVVDREPTTQVAKSLNTERNSPQPEGASTEKITESSCSDEVSTPLEDAQPNQPAKRRGRPKKSPTIQNPPKIDVSVDLPSVIIADDPSPQPSISKLLLFATQAAPITARVYSRIFAELSTILAERASE